MRLDSLKARIPAALGLFRHGLDRGKLDGFDGWSGAGWRGGGPRGEPVVAGSSMTCVALLRGVAAQVYTKARRTTV